MSDFKDIKTRHERDRWKDALFIGAAVLLTALALGAVTSKAAGKPHEIEGKVTVIENEQMPDPAAGSHSIAFGDFRRGYKIADIIGMRTLRDDLTKKPYVGFYTTKRLGGGVEDSNAIIIHTLGV